MIGWLSPVMRILNNRNLVIEPAALEQIMIFYVNRIVAVVMLGACRKKKLRKYNNA